tara:strand:+ start:522 stop:827 length:306 start_codon:yes stop_codon:yes gene_type:complete
MKHVNINVIEKDNAISVNVVVAEQREYPFVPIILLSTADIEKYLKENGIEYGSIIEEARNVHNKRNHNREGTWVFHKKQAKPPAPKKRRTRASAKKKTTEE